MKALGLGGGGDGEADEVGGASVLRLLLLLFFGRLTCCLGADVSAPWGASDLCSSRRGRSGNLLVFPKPIGALLMMRSVSISAALQSLECQSS